VASAGDLVFKSCCGRKVAVGRFRSATRLDSPLPRRPGAVTPKGPKRSVGAAKPLDGDGAAWLSGVGALAMSRGRHRAGVSSGPQGLTSTPWAPFSVPLAQGEAGRNDSRATAAPRLREGRAIGGVEVGEALQLISGEALQLIWGYKGLSGYQRTSHHRNGIAIAPRWCTAAKGWSDPG
jgi:hypothetical protein